MRIRTRGVRRSLRGLAPVPAAIAWVVVAGLLAAGSGAAATPAGTVAYLLPLGGANITDHNLTFATNMVRLDPAANASFRVTLTSTLVANGSVPSDRAEVEVGLAPVPAGPDETNITPLFIVQESAAGLLRIEYIPFPMNDTYGFEVYDGTPVSPGPSDFVGHVLTLAYTETAPPVPAYAETGHYGRTTGNLTVLWDGTVLVPPYPVAWASLGAFYIYGLTTGAFLSGTVRANVTTLPAELPAPATSPVLPNGDLGAVPVWAVAGAVGAVVGGATVAVAVRRRTIH